MAKLNDSLTPAERLHLLLADALYSALPTDTAETVRNRVLQDVSEVVRLELDALIRGKRLLYAE